MPYGHGILDTKLNADVCTNSHTGSTVNLRPEVAASLFRRWTAKCMGGRPELSGQNHSPRYYPLTVDDCIRRSGYWAKNSQAAKWCRDRKRLSLKIKVAHASFRPLTTSNPPPTHTHPDHHHHHPPLSQHSSCGVNACKWWRDNSLWNAESSPSF